MVVAGPVPGAVVTRRPVPGCRVLALVLIRCGEADVTVGRRCRVRSHHRGLGSGRVRRTGRLGDRVTPPEHAGKHREDEHESRCQAKTGRAVHVAFMLRNALDKVDTTSPRRYRRIGSGWPTFLVATCSARLRCGRMGHNCGGGDRGVRDLRARGVLLVLAAVTAALLVHLFGPALHPTTASASSGHGHGEIALVAADHPDHEYNDDLGDNIRADAHDGESCHSVVGLAPATTVLPGTACSAVTWRSIPPATDVRHAIRSAAIGGDGCDASLDPQRSPGVQRT